MSRPAPVVVAGREIGPDKPCLVIAEAGVNHDGDIVQALRLVEAAKAAGADAVKFQTFQATSLATPSATKAAYQKERSGSEESQLDMLRRLELSRDDHLRLIERCRELDILFLSSPFEEASADFLDELGVPAFKIPSGEIVNLPFLCHLAAKGKPLILSTGMSTLAEVEAAVTAIESAGNPGLVLLHCVSRYPSDPADSNLLAMRTLEIAFGRPTGFSDHTPGIAVALAAAALGAVVLEKHFTLDRNLPGPDHAVSLEPDELAALVRGVREVRLALGTGRKTPVPSELEIALAARKSLVAATDIPDGTILDRDMIALRRPGHGLPPSAIPRILGRRASAVIAEGTLLSPEMFR